MIGPDWAERQAGSRTSDASELAGHIGPVIPDSRGPAGGKALGIQKDIESARGGERQEAVCARRAAPKARLDPARAEPAIPAGIRALDHLFRRDLYVVEGSQLQRTSVPLTSLAVDSRKPC